MKKVLLAWSGGFDSTAAAIKMLNDGFAVNAVYLKLGNNSVKIKRELEAIDRLIPLLSKDNKPFRYIGSCGLDGVRGNENSISKQPPIWAFLAPLKYTDEDYFAFGYIRHDDFWHMEGDFRRALSANFKFAKGENTVPDTWYPVEIERKPDILKMIMEYDPEIFKHCTSCESVNKNLKYNDICCECETCIKLMNGVVEAGYVEKLPGRIVGNWFEYYLKLQEIIQERSQVSCLKN